MTGANSIDHLEKRSGICRDQLLTVRDLEDFKKALFHEIRNLLGAAKNQNTKKWLRSCEVRKMLAVSPGTLQNPRINRILTFSKVGGIVFYKYDDIASLLEMNSNAKSEY